MSLSLNEFLKIQNQFKLGHLTTESFHPKSMNLSQTVKKDINKAVNILQEIDKDALLILKTKSDKIFELQVKVQSVLKSGHKVYLSGCGATGRLAISLEKIYRDKFKTDQVVGFMAGGDYALIRSVESFEDNSNYGKKQLEELGFSSNDLLIGITEGGETSFVIGSVEYAGLRSSEMPYFIYCNPDSELSKIKRSREIIQNTSIKKLNLSVGPMAISGSTRMQATTVQMISVGFALMNVHNSIESFKKEFDSFIDDLIELDLNFLDKFIQEEFNVYESDGIVTYKADPSIAISILTDTTERAPTFDLNSFENSPQEKLSLSYLAINKTGDAKDAWFQLLSRAPRCLSWDEIERDISESGVYAFNISEESIARRSKLKRHETFHIKVAKEFLIFKLLNAEFNLNIENKSLFFIHMALKLIMNTHSTLLMGLMNRYEGNMMTYVKSSNLKLIDRSCRYIKELLRQKKIIVSDTEVIKEILEGDHDSDQPIVLSVFNKFYYAKKIEHTDI